MVVPDPNAKNTLAKQSPTETQIPKKNNTNEAKGGSHLRARNY